MRRCGHQAAGGHRTRGLVATLPSPDGPAAFVGCRPSRLVDSLHRREGEQRAAHGCATDGAKGSGSARPVAARVPSRMRDWGARARGPGPASRVNRQSPRDGVARAVARASAVAGGGELLRRSWGWPGRTAARLPLRRGRDSDPAGTGPSCTRGLLAGPRAGPVDRRAPRTRRFTAGRGANTIEMDNSEVAPRSATSCAGPPARRFLPASSPGAD